MAKLYYRFGTMDSSKTSRLLMDAYEYQQRGEYVVIVKPSIDTRDTKVKSRVGLEADCLTVSPTDNLYELLKSMNIKPKCVFVDEAQFLTYTQVVALRIYVDTMNIPVMCYGLKSDFMGNLFEGSRGLFQHANRFEEIKTICRHEGCNHKAMYNTRYLNGKPVFEGNSVVMGHAKEVEDEYYYIPQCPVHYFQDLTKFQLEGK